MKIYFIYALFSLLLISCSNSFDGELIFVEPDGNDGFEYPYFLFIPDDVSKNEKVYLIIEPNNSGFADDDFQKHVESAKRTATIDFYLGNYLTRKLKYPLMVPVFPRSKTEWKIYTHALDRDVMQQKDNPLERIDNQLIAMFRDAQSKLESKNINTQDQFLLTGFSASGTFANRFTLLHPDRVFAVAAGGLNGLLMIPADSLNNEMLNYPIGVGDFKELTNEEFQKQLFLSTPQFYFMGRLDENDAIPYADAFAQHEREQIFRLLGERMQPERWDRCAEIYRNSNVNAIIKTYDTIGHEHPDGIKKEIVEFFKECIRKK